MQSLIVRRTPELRLFSELDFVGNDESLNGAHLIPGQRVAERRHSNIRQDAFQHDGFERAVRGRRQVPKIRIVQRKRSA
jgi:hypothetical protein